MLNKTDENLLSGGLEVIQPKTGYRFSIDALMLAHHVTPTPDDRIVDIGTGCGIIALLLARRFPDALISGVEVQPELARLAKFNAKANHLAGRVRIIHKDIRKVTASDTGPVEIITCNPPHIPVSSGRLNPDDQAAVARHEILMTISDLTAAAHRLLNPKGRLFTIYPADRLTELLIQMRKAGLEPKQVRTVHFKPDAPARRIILQAVKDGQPGLEMPPPLFIHDSDGAYTPEALSIMNPDTSGRNPSPKS